MDFKKKEYIIGKIHGFENKKRIIKVDIILHLQTQTVLFLK